MRMITLITNNINTFNQNSYNTLINSINLNQVTCSCGHCGCLTKHAYYNRRLKINGGTKLTLSVLRVRCSVCGKTHAVLPDIIVPYSQVTLNDHITIIANSTDHKSQTEVMDDNPLIDESCISYIIRTFRKHWYQRLTAYRISLHEIRNTFVSLCFKHFRRQFMQIKCTTNILYEPTHTT